MAILDAGSQYGGLIDRNVRELGVRTELLPVDTPANELQGYGAVIISGGPSSVYEKNAPQCDPKLFDAGKPVLGICYGMQLMARHLGGAVGKTGLREDGPQQTKLVGQSPLFKGLKPSQEVLMSHGDSVTKQPQGFEIIAASDDLVTAIADQKRRLFGTQFHPEVFQTKNGRSIFENFLFGVAELEADYTLDDQEQEAIDNIREVVGEREVVLFLSGGVDSTVLGALMAKAILDKSRIHAFHIDHGFMRANESEEVIKALQVLGVDVELLERRDLFYNATTVIDGQETPPLHAVTDPQVKRKIIGDTFAGIRGEVIKARALSEDAVLAQGTLRPDLIESGSHLASSKADTIKTHHNDTEEVRKLRREGRVAEPLQSLYKDQVRALGRRLGLPASIVERHPFPGPGLAIRIICAERPYRLATHDKVQATLDELLAANNTKDFKAHLLPVQTVGVQGDGRSYKYLVGLEGPADWVTMAQLANLITNRIHQVNRVAYVFGKVERQKLGITPTLLTPEAIDQLRHADAIATQALMSHGAMDRVSQMPVVSLPVDFGQKGMRSIALRPFITPDFMTGIAAIPGDALSNKLISEMATRIASEVPGIARVIFDLTSKPPGTTEWE